MKMNINKLPTEILMFVFENLEPKDLKLAAQVCHKWNDICSLPRMWTWVHLYIDSSNLSEIQMMMESKRLEYLRNLIVDLGTHQLLGKSLNNNRWKRLKYLNLTSCDLRESGPEVFNDIIPTTLEKLQLDQLRMTQDQQVGIFRLIGEKTGLKEISLTGIDLMTTLMTNVSTLTTLSLLKCKLITEQVVAFSTPLHVSTLEIEAI